MYMYRVLLYILYMLVHVVKSFIYMYVHTLPTYNIMLQNVTREYTCKLKYMSPDSSYQRGLEPDEVLYQTSRWTLSQQTDLMDKHITQHLNTNTQHRRV